MNEAGFTAMYTLGQIRDQLGIALYLLTIATGIVALLVLPVLIGFIVHGAFPLNDAYLLARLPDKR